MYAARIVRSIDGPCDISKYAAAGYMVSENRKGSTEFTLSINSHFSEGESSDAPEYRIHQEVAVAV